MYIYVLCFLEAYIEFIPMVPDEKKMFPAFAYEALHPCFRCHMLHKFRGRVVSMNVVVCVNGMLNDATPINGCSSADEVVPAYIALISVSFL